MRKERDFLGEVNISEDAYYGISTQRAKENFNISNKSTHIELIYAVVIIKKAAAITNYENKEIDETLKNAICQSCDEILTGKFDKEFIIDQFQGGAGTSTNMNVNEVVANRANEILGGKKGDYKLCNPLDHVNKSQSTNDVYPTALRISLIRKVKNLSEKLADLQTVLQEKEQEFANILKVGRTQLQDAVPITLGQEFGAYAQGISRDRWRIYKVQERLRVVNLGGTAVGTGINASSEYIFRVVEVLRELTGLAIARTDYMMDITQNADVFVEVSGLIKTAAVNLGKMANDLRLLSSGPKAGIGEIKLPEVQTGSSIMPGKVNPVILEAINQIVFQVFGNDQVVTFAATSGQLELNQFLPVIAKNMFEMIDILNNGITMLCDKCLKGIQPDKERCEYLVKNSYSIATVLVKYIGYDKASEIAKKSLESKKSIKEILLEEKIFDSERIDKILNPTKMTAP